MDELAILHTLTQQALTFHRALVAHAVYRMPLSDAEFLRRTQEDILLRVQNVLHAREDIRLVQVSLPVDLMYDLFDVIAAISWDYEWGYGRLCRDLEHLFKQTPFRFQWQYHPAHKRLTYALDDTSWTCEGIDLQEDVAFPFDAMERNLAAYLQHHGWAWYSPATGDQSGMIVLMPREAVEGMRDYLIAYSDPRWRWLYEGIE